MNLAALLPEGKLFDLVYAEAIAPAASEANAAVVRLNLALSPESTRAALFDQVRNTDLLVVDLTGKNPNAMFAAGYAEGIQRKILFIVQHLEDFPLDRNAHHVIAYAGDRPFLRSELRSYFSTLAGTQQQAASPDGAHEKFLLTFGDILAKHGYKHRGDIQMENSSTFVLLNQDMDLALVQELARRARELGLRLKLM